MRSKIIHILPHNIFKFFPELNKDFSNISNLIHHSTKFVSDIIDYDIKNKFINELWLIWDVRKMETITHNKWFVIKIFPQDFRIFLPLETSFSMFQEIKKEIKNSEQKIIWHIHSYYLWMFDFLIIYLSIKKQTIFAHHRWWWFTWKALPYSIYKYLFILPIILRFCDKIFIQNKTELNRINNKYFINKNKLVYFPNSIKKQIQKIDKKNDNHIKIVFLWRLEKVKWISDILESILYLKNNNIRFEITFIWEWTQKDFIFSYCKINKINFNITWWIWKKELENILIKSYISLIANRKKEWSSNSVLEAQSFWIPVISYDIEWINDFIINNETGYLVKNLEEYKNKLLYLCNNQDAHKYMSKKSIININNNFEKNKYFEELIYIYEYI